MLKAGQIVKVKWRDSSTVEGWTKPPVTGEGNVESVGFVVEHTLRTLTLTTSRATNGAVLDPISIPQGAIDEVVEMG